jgi:hypothetical protein
LATFHRHKTERVTEQDRLDIVKCPRAEAERPEAQSRRSLWTWKTNPSSPHCAGTAGRADGARRTHNGPAFQVFVEQLLVPELERRLGHLDDLRSHLVQAQASSLSAAGYESRSTIPDLQLRGEPCLEQIQRLPERRRQSRQLSHTLKALGPIGDDPVAK